MGRKEIMILKIFTPSNQTKKQKKYNKNKNKNLIKKCLFYPTAYLYGLTGAGLLGVVRGA